MKLHRLIIAALAATMAMTVVGGASAHYGDRWFMTKPNATHNIEAKYRLDVYQKCIPDTINGHVLPANDFGAVGYDHFVCLVRSMVSNRYCWVTAHITGGRWSDIVLTSYTAHTNMRRDGGCTPSDIRRR